MAISPHHASRSPTTPAADECDEALDHELPHLLQPARAERRADGELAASRRCMREDDARHVRARDAEHDERNRRQQIDDGVDVGAEQLEEGPHHDAGFCVGDREVGLELARNGGEIGFGLFDLHAGLEHRGDEQPAIVAAVALAIEHDRSDEVDRPEDAPADIGWQDADDRVRAAVDRKGFANRVVRCGELPLPEAVAHNNHLLPAGRGFVGGERAPKLRSDAPHVEEISRCPNGADAGRHVETGEHRVLECERRKCVEAVRALGPVDQVWNRDAGARQPIGHARPRLFGPRVRRRHEDEPVGANGGNEAPHHVDRAGDDGGCRNRNRQSCDDHGGTAWRLCEGAKRELQVVHGSGDNNIAAKGAGRNGLVSSGPRRRAVRLWDGVVRVGTLKLAKVTRSRWIARFESCVEAAHGLRPLACGGVT